MIALLLTRPSSGDAWPQMSGHHKPLLSRQPCRTDHMLLFIPHCWQDAKKILFRNLLLPLKSSSPLFVVHVNYDGGRLPLTSIFLRSCQLAGILNAGTNILLSDLVSNI